MNYANMIRKKFPCPKGYSEVEKGYCGVAFDRISMQQVTLSPPECNEENGCILATDTAGKTTGEFVWFYVKLARLLSSGKVR